MTLWTNFRRSLLYAAFCFIHFSAFSQDYPLLFEKKASISKADKQDFFSKNKLKEGTIFTLNEAFFKSIQKEKQTQFSFSIPIEDNQFLDITLEEHNIFAPDFKVIVHGDDGEKEVPYQRGLHYYGSVNGAGKSLAAFSFFEDEIMAVLSFGGDNYNLELLDSEDFPKSEHTYIFYKEKDVIGFNGFQCHTADGQEFNGNPSSPNAQNQISTGNKSSMTDIEIYVECDFDLQFQLGSHSAATNYITALFSVVKGIFEDAGGAGMGPSIVMSELYIWFSFSNVDPYLATAAGATTDAVLKAFKCNRPIYNGNIAHLLTGSSVIGVGAGFSDTPECPAMGGTYSKGIYGYSNIGTTFSSNLNIYSATVSTFTHELGHNLGSPHTHECVWGVNNNEQIDDCGNVYQVFNNQIPEGDACLDPDNLIIPMEGSIMSYCDLLPDSIPTSINLANGFHPEVAFKINEFSDCLSSTTCYTVIPSVSNVTMTSATLSCDVNPLADSYTFFYRELTSPTYEDITSTANTINISNLIANTGYTFYIEVDCVNLGTSNVSCDQEFLTEGDCEPNFTKHVLSGSIDQPREVATGDLNGDQKMDIIALAKNDLSWWENFGSGIFIEHNITTSVNSGVAVQVADLNGDSYLDLVGATLDGDEIIWWKNDGYGNFTEIEIDGDFIRANYVALADIDLDGDIDIAATGYESGLAIWLNDGKGSFNKKQIDHPIDGPYQILSQFGVAVGDINGDGVEDLITAQSEFIWWENDGSENFSAIYIDSNKSVQEPQIFDFDGDNDLDIAASFSTSLIWWENDGTGVFTENNIDNTFFGALDLQGGDADADGDIDLLGSSLTNSFSSHPNAVLWENDGLGGFHKIPIESGGSQSKATSTVYFADVDGDCSQDILLGYLHADYIAWFESDCDAVNPCLIAPRNEQTNVDINADLTWTGAINAAGYYLTVGTGPCIGNILDSVDVGNVTTYALPQLPYNTTIYVEVEPYDTSGMVGFTKEEYFSTEICVSNLVITGNPIPAKNHYSIGDLTAHDAVIIESSSVNFMSDTTILLDFNFEIELGAEFQAIIEGCPTN